MPRKHILNRWSGVVIMALVLGALRPPQQTIHLPKEATPPEDKIAQLLLITWDGTFPEDEAHPLWETLRTYAIGGVVLSPPPGRMLSREEVASFVARAQTLAQLHSQDVVRRNGASPPFLPLFIAVHQPGNAAPEDVLAFPQPLPPYMAIAATWNPDNAYRVGFLLGKALQVWGINMLFGPSLNVADPAQYGQPGDLGLETFGENPYWVTEMARAYIRGLHEGAQNRLAVVVTTFPGFGGAARPLSEDIPTLPMTRDQVEAVYLRPFLVLAASEIQTEQPDGMLIGHIRSQALQGTVKADTPPLSLDLQALSGVWKAYPALQAWYWGAPAQETTMPTHLRISADLGSPAIKRYMAAQGKTYDPEQVAITALLAGNDMLWLGQGFVQEGQDYWQTVNQVITALGHKYTTDPVFAQRVDEAVARVQAAKNRLFLSAREEDEAPDRNVADFPEDLEARLVGMAQQSATRLAPGPDEEWAPPPGPQTRILFLVDRGLVASCPECTPVETLPPDTLRTQLLALYGPAGRGDIQPGQIAFADDALVEAWMTNRDVTLRNRMETLVRWADWVVLFLQHPTSPGTQILLQALETKPELTREKWVEVFAMGPPYALQASHLAQVDAYYALYGKTPAARTLALRLLFRDAAAEGASPVSLPALGYSLQERLSPNPHQEIPVAWLLPGVGATTEPAHQTFQLNQTITVQAGPVLDRNGHPVPDDTPLSLLLTGAGGQPVYQRIEVLTRNGIGRASFTLDREGLFEIHAQSGEAVKSRILTVEVLALPTPPTIPLPTPTATPIPTPQGPSVQTTPPDFPPTLLLIGTWGFGALLIGLIAWYHRQNSQQALRWALVALNLEVWTGIFAYRLHIRPSWIWGASTLFALMVTLLAEQIPIRWRSRKTTRG